MNNPFEELFPAEELPKKEVEAQVMGSIHFKSFMADIAEFFMAIFGITIVESLAQNELPDQNGGNQQDESVNKTESQ